MKSFLKLLFAGSLFLNLAYAQTPAAKNILKDKTIKKALELTTTQNTGKLHFKTTHKSLSFPDTNKWESTIQYFIPKGADSAMFISRSSSGVLLFDFEEEFNYSSKKNLVKTRHRNWDAAYRNIYFSNYLPYTTQGYFIQKFLDRNDSTTKELRDTVIDERTYKVLHFYKKYPDYPDTLFTDSDVRFFISPDDGIVRKYIVSVKGMGGQQYSTTELLSADLRNEASPSKFLELIQHIKDSITALPDVSVEQVSLKAQALLKPLDSNTAAPDWKLPRHKDDSLALDNIDAKLILLDFWFASCYPCKMNLPFLDALYKDYKDKGLEIIAVNPIDHYMYVEDYAWRHDISYPMLYDAKEVAASYSISGFPTFYLLDENRKIIYSHIGYDAEKNKDLREVIAKLLEK